ncbi:glycoside hydrolase family 97 catalytic domain-containing protein [Lentzea aerocolonigenes]|uniref:glycoside hydrolase family 97 catalytic domain-containing protein n=1 Tax=Lentzea aerocolonigenes TaxID=68170 RepID=UPI000A784FC2|nr:glycoside hydrolase family 97 catalytic domain-containing protein [Lentzea aerocolonigenes]MCP2250646.1 NPCBM-associated, NEW3 domain of alpha-galactosidase [Lentzea aerocolonigenes]
MAVKTLVVAVLAAGLVVPPAQAGTNGPQAVVSSSGGTITLAVTHKGKTIVQPSPVGITTERADLSSGLTLVGKSRRAIFEHYRTTSGKKRDRVVRATETTYRFTSGANRLDLVVRESADGVAYRYELPQDTGAVTGEASAFVLPADATAWLAKFRRDYENPFLRMTAGTAEQAEYMHPALFDVGGTYALITESDVDGRYSGGHLVHTGGGRYQVKLWDEKVSGARKTPWRTMIVGSLATVVKSTLVDDLAPPSRIGDTSWIKPGPAVWTWLAGGRTAQQDLAKQKEFVDYAAARGWPYVVVDAGWYDDPNWRQTSFIPELVRYAKARNVGIHTWVRFSSVDTPEKRADYLPWLQRWGVRGLKIDFMDSDGQERYRWYDEILPETARMHFLVNFHGATLPHGVHRTWPHVMTTEAVHGAEKSSGLTTSHITALPFTRNVVGGMDYTPGGFHRARANTDGGELALSVLYESGIQNLAGRPDSYDARPLARWFLEQAPTAWDETRLLSGRPGEDVVMARRDGDRWFVGGAIAGEARTLDLPALGGGRWLVEIVRDGAAGLVKETQVTDQKLTIPVAKDGGFAAIVCRPVRDTCARSTGAIPSTTVVVSPEQVSVQPGQTFEMSGTFTNTSDRSLYGVTFAPRVPSGWSASRAVRAFRVAPGESVNGRWTVTVGANPVAGLNDVPAVARFSGVEAEKATRTHVWKPLPAGQFYVPGNDLSVEGRTLTTGGVRFGKGIGTTPADKTFEIGTCTRFDATVGVDDEVDGRVDRAAGVGGTVTFVVVGDGRVLYESPLRKSVDPALPVSVDVGGVRSLTLRVTDGGDGTSLDNAVWGDARLVC